jgi:hypothetical protein
VLQIVERLDRLERSLDVHQELDEERGESEAEG